jgi:hypothetical protein
MVNFCMKLNRSMLRATAWIKQIYSILVEVAKHTAEENNV